MIERDVLASTREFARESRTQSWIAVGSTFALLALCTVTAFVARPWPVRVIASLLEALLIVRAFILFHDFQHNAILRGSKIARAFFWTFGLTVLTPPRVWRDTHNYHHANNAKIVGSHVGPWQDQELAAFMRQFVRRRCPVIPVLLPGAERPELPAFLDGMTWVDLAASGPDPLDQLEWGITGRHPDR